MKSTTLTCYTCLKKVWRTGINVVMSTYPEGSIMAIGMDLEGGSNVAISVDLEGLTMQRCNVHLRNPCLERLQKPHQSMVTTSCIATTRSCKPRHTMRKRHLTVQYAQFHVQSWKTLWCAWTATPMREWTLRNGLRRRTQAPRLET